MANKFTQKKHIFHKYDVRGIYGEDIDEETVASIAGALASKVFQKGKVVLGHDARNSSSSLYQSAKDALEKEGAEVLDIGMMTTPMLAFLINNLKADGGIMITASHNPKEYNGVKAAKRNGEPIGGEEIYKLL